MREMKDSGENWLGSIPAKWKMARIKDVIKILTDYTANGSFADLAKNVEYLDYEDFARLVRLTDLRSKLNNPGVYVSQKSYEYLGKSKLYGKEILVANVGAYAGLFCEMPNVDIPATLGPNMFLIRTNSKMYSHYLYYLGNTHFVKEQLAQKAISSAQPKLNKTDIKTAYIIIPPILEQKRIISFLDSQCSEIDAVSADIQKEIDTLEQYKRSVITEAVTKGLNPDVEMKDSGIEWVGNIPAHWDTIPIRYLFAECRLKNILNQEKTALKFTYGTIIKKTNFDSDSDEYVANTMTNYTVVYPGTIMINGLNLNYDFVSQRVGLVKDRGAITSAYLAIVPGSRVVSEYANYQLKSWDYAKAFHNMGTGVRKTLDFSELGKKYFVTPSIEEQSKIVAFLDSKCKEIEAIIASKKQQLTVIDSYKKSLIYEYVTGKKEVPAQN